MAFYEKWQSERYNIGCKVWEARCPNCHELVESADPISSNYRFCPYCGFDMKSDFQRVADRRQFAECLIKLKEAKRLLKAAVEDFAKLDRENAKNKNCMMPEMDCTDCPLSWDSVDDRVEPCHSWRYANEAEKLLNDEK